MGIKSTVQNGPWNKKKLGKAVKVVEPYRSSFSARLSKIIMSYGMGLMEELVSILSEAIGTELTMREGITLLTALRPYLRTTFLPDRLGLVLLLRVESTAVRTKYRKEFEGAIQRAMDNADVHVMVLVTGHREAAGLEADILKMVTGDRS